MTQTMQPAPAAVEQPTTGAQDRPGAGAATQLRLALVCYGGVSLAVYMHGITKELHKVVVASRRFDEVGDVPNPFPPGDTEHVYFEALRTLAAEGRPRSVTIDVIAGTSAGGINGVVLAKVLAVGGTQDELRRVWIEEGDLRTLLRAPALGSVRLQLALGGLRVLGRLRKPVSPLRGERMSRLLCGALESIDRQATGSLLPRGGTLDLYVTTTDLRGFEVLVAAGAGGASQRDRCHAQVLEFHAEHGDAAHLGPAGSPWLAFAARATSSFPGAFAPVNLASFAVESGSPIGAEPGDLRFRYPYEGSGDAWYVDGGVLDNAPFDLVVEAVSHKRADTEVLRRVVYVQPDPGQALGVTESLPAAPEPGWLDALWQATTSVKGSHGVLRDLLAFQELNQRIAEVGAVTARSMDDVAQHVEQARHLVAAGHPADRVYVQDVSDEMHRRTAEALGAGHATYVRLKVEAAGRRIADEIAEHFEFPRDSSRSSFLRAAVGAWARSTPEWASQDLTTLLAWLRPVDVPYRERRLLFLLAGVNELYGLAGGDAPPRQGLDALKGRAWDLLEELRRQPVLALGDLGEPPTAFLQGAALDAVRLADPARFAADHRDEFAALFAAYQKALAERLGDGGTALWQAYRDVTGSWPAAASQRLLVRYLGFPLWDGLIFPTVALARLPQFTPVPVSQFSPRTAAALTPPPEPARRGRRGRAVPGTQEPVKLKGVGVHHFAGFLEAQWRENDYLWGRLDGVELVLRTLRQGGGADVDLGVDQTPDSPAQALRAAGPHLPDGLRAVLAAEAGLGRVQALRAELATQVAALAGPRRA